MFFKGDMKRLENVTISNLLPTTHDFMTYEGSQTQPGCSETVTWIIMNKPIYITHKQVGKFRVVLFYEIIRFSMKYLFKFKYWTNIGQILDKN